MTEDSDFEDWSHPTRTASLPARRVRWRWYNVMVWSLVAAVCCGVLVFFWYIGHVIAQAYRVVFRS